MMATLGSKLANLPYLTSIFTKSNLGPGSNPVNRHVGSC